MSSRVVRSDDCRDAPLLIWRDVGTAPAKAADESREDLAAQLSRMQQECEHRVREAHAAGLREGEAAGHKRAVAEFQPVVERLARAVDELASLRPRLRKEAEADMVKLSLAIARRVLRRELVVDPEALHGLVLGALEKLQGQEVCRVRVHPKYAPAIASYLSNSASGQKVEVLPDASREPGAAVFETARGNLDASVESQLQEIERGLTDQLNRRS